MAFEQEKGRECGMHESEIREDSISFREIQTNLKNLGYKVTCFQTAGEAADYLDGEIDNKTVGFGGSMTLEQMGLFDRLLGHNKVSWHWRIPDGKTALDMQMESRRAEIYISSVNGIASTGEIINIDGRCNRVAETLYGHEKVILVIGENKIAADYDKALYRAPNVAAPLNARRLGVKTPCAQKGDRCYNCSSSDRICRGLTVLWEPPMGSDIEIVLIHEQLGY